MAKPSRGSAAADTAPLDWVQITTRLRPDLHTEVENRKGRHEIKSINMFINEAVEEHLARTAGEVKIHRIRRRLRPRSDPARAAVAYLLAYLGNQAQAKRQWPWAGRFAVKAGDTDVLPMAGALIVQEIDRWATSAAPSASTR